MTDAADASAIAAMSFEDAMKELESVVNRLEHGDATLEDSIALYERGAKLREHCESRLKAAEERVERITLASGKPTGTTPVEGL
ncbi:exodeoxyribonuclease VII small subunit [Paracoccus suum]|uniref:Exodeoxyribonuclease 7 small subunit n=1 Tax=Paracoccus suum TaxID=2259340 RepID=A0A344PIQ1_9RHOB|nr:exodeoxyribonuclease VII small subunit [Paracoccus suum]AXC49256.1 exodeoxyribonuclease VII small subunit [Paracoccus suum]